MAPAAAKSSKPIARSSIIIIIKGHQSKSSGVCHASDDDDMADSLLMRNSMQSSVLEKGPHMKD